MRYFLGALLYFGFAFISPIALVAAPLGLLLLFQRPGRRESLIALGLVVLAGWSALSGTEGFARFEGAWVLMLSGGTVIALALRPPQRAGLTGSGLFAVGIAGTVGTLAIGLTNFSWGELRWLAQRHYGLQSRLLLEAMSRALSGTEGGPDVIQAMEAAFNQVVEVISLLLPALVLLQSMAALAAAWALYQKLARHPEGDPLPRLREFRFSDHLIWGIVFALVTLVYPGASGVRMLGGNLAAFFGGLYVVRGLGVVSALAAAAGVGGPFAALLASFATFFLFPLVMFGALALGVTDTWVDWRRIAARKSTG